jgi:hypothetical protein
MRTFLLATVAAIGFGAPQRQPRLPVRRRRHGPRPALELAAPTTSFTLSAMAAAASASAPRATRCDVGNFVFFVSTARYDREVSTTPSATAPSGSTHLQQRRQRDCVRWFGWWRSHTDFNLRWPGPNATGFFGSDAPLNPLGGDCSSAARECAMTGAGRCGSGPARAVPEPMSLALFAWGWWGWDCAQGEGVALRWTHGFLDPAPRESHVSEPKAPMIATLGP